MRPPALTLISSFFWSYILGPVLSLLPARWRAKWFGGREISWRGATIISGGLQFLIGPVALLAWYSFLVGGWASRVVDYLLGRAPNVELNEAAVGFLGLSVVAIHPVTWIIFYLFLEGAGRAIAAAIVGEVNGTLPLVLLDRAYLFARRRLWAKEPLWTSDLVTLDEARAEWQLKIEASQAKYGWEAGRLVRYGDAYFRLESCCESEGTRPFVYTLRQLPAGVPSRSVIFYSLQDAPDTSHPLHPSH
jgi:hypothetical protein